MEKNLNVLEFLKEMVNVIGKRFERCENLIKQLTNEIDEIRRRVEAIEKNVQLVGTERLNETLLKVLEGREKTAS